MANGFIQKGKLYKDSPQSEVKHFLTATQKNGKSFLLKSSPFISLKGRRRSISFFDFYQASKQHG